MSKKLVLRSTGAGKMISQSQVDRRLGMDWEREILSLQADMRTGSRGMFMAYFDNHKKRGRGQPVQYRECEGTLYSSGHVHLDTQELRCADFGSLQQMLDYLQEFGDVALVWLDEDTQATSRQSGMGGRQA